MTDDYSGNVVVEYITLAYYIIIIWACTCTFVYLSREQDVFDPFVIPDPDGKR